MIGAPLTSASFSQCSRGIVAPDSSMKPSPRSPSTSARASWVSGHITSEGIGVPSKSDWAAPPAVGAEGSPGVPSVWEDQPQAPASMASFSSRFSSSVSSAVGLRPAFASSSPSTQISSGFTPT
jgi:hypothetical protein